MQFLIKKTKRLGNENLALKSALAEKEGYLEWEKARVRALDFELERLLCNCQTAFPHRGHKEHQVGCRYYMVREEIEAKLREGLILLGDMIGYEPH